MEKEKLEKKEEIKSKKKWSTQNCLNLSLELDL